MEGYGGLAMRKIGWGDPGKAPWKRCCLSWEGELDPKEKQGEEVYSRQEDSFTSCAQSRRLQNPKYTWGAGRGSGCQGFSASPAVKQFSICYKTHKQDLMPPPAFQTLEKTKNLASS